MGKKWERLEVGKLIKMGTLGRSGSSENREVGEVRKTERSLPDTQTATDHSEALVAGADQY